MELLYTYEPIKYISLRQAKSYIDNIDFSMIINKMVARDDWLEDEALAVCKMYRNYLFLQKKYKDQFELPPSEEIDEFWHQHIFDTKKYHTDCEAIFGKYLHHYPYLGADDITDLKYLNNAFEKTQELYEKKFDKKIQNVRKGWLFYLMHLLIFKPFKRVIT